MLGNDQIINYEYSMELIKEIDNKNKSIKNNIIARIIMSKICIDLIEKFEITNHPAYDREPFPFSPFPYPNMKRL